MAGKSCIVWVALWLATSVVSFCYTPVITLPPWMFPDTTKWTMGAQSQPLSKIYQPRENVSCSLELQYSAG